MATIVDPTTAIQKKVNVSIEGGKAFSESVYFLELWPVEKATEKTIEVKDEGRKLTGAFELIQFKFDKKNNNFIYTSSDGNQKATYAGTASGFSISGFSAGAVIRIGKTDSPKDVTEMYRGPAERVDVKVDGNMSSELVSEPKEGFIKEGGWGGNPDPATWEITRMKADPKLFEIVDNAGKTIATDFGTRETAQQYIDYQVSVYPKSKGLEKKDTQIDGEIDEFGIKRLVPVIGRIWKDVSYRSRDRDTGLREFFTIKGVDGMALACVGYYTTHLIDNDEDLAHRVFGGNHAGSGRKNNALQGRCYRIGIKRNGSPSFQKEYPQHPVMEDFSDKVTFFDTSFDSVGSVRDRSIGLAIFAIANKTTKRVDFECWVDPSGLTMDGTPANNWKPFYKISDTGELKGEPYLENQGIKNAGDGIYYMRLDVSKKTRVYGLSVYEINTLPSVIQPPRSDRSKSITVERSPALEDEDTSKKESVSLRDDFVPLVKDDPTNEDRLGRRPFAKHLAIRLKNIYSQEDPRAFLLHIHGHWGSGKSSLLEMLAHELKNGEPAAAGQKPENKKWFVVKFNAWQHERSGPPWWSLMNSVYNQSVKQLALLPRLKLMWHENFWRIRNGLAHRFFWPFVILAGIVVILLITDTQALISATATGNSFLDFIQNKVGLVVATAVAIVGGILALSTSLAPGSARAARQFIDTVEDPTYRLSSHFKDLRKRIGHPIVVFIDDLDRCQHDYTVELLERIQTLFRDVNVIYVVAADRRWIYTSYDKAYETFRSSMDEPGRPLQFMFLEKIFQLSMYVPPIDPKMKEQFWKYLLTNKISNPNELTEKIEAATKAEEEKFRNLNTEREVLNEIKVLNENNNERDKVDAIRESAKRGAAIVKLASMELQEDIESRLAPFWPLVDSNPRLMKRVVNAYTMALATEINSSQGDIANTDRLALRTILSLRWPRLDEYLEEHPNHIKYIGNLQDEDGKDIPEIPDNVKSTIPKDIYDLFHDPRVIDVVTGNARDVKASLRISK